MVRSLPAPNRCALTSTGSRCRRLIGSRVGRGGPHQPGEQADVGGRLGVPLHGRRRTGRPAASIASSVPSAACADGDEPGVVAHRLVVVAVDRQRRSPTSAGDPGARPRSTTVDRAERVAAGAVLARGRPGRACAGRARPPACTAITCMPRQTPEHRQADGLGGVEQRELPGVAVGPPVGGARVRLGAVPRPGRRRRRR